jgi:hypothetical protein
MAQTKLKTEQLPVVTTIATPGLDTTIPTEQAVREAIVVATTSPVPAGNLFLYSICQ